jgi:hypothetical protein
MKRIILLFVLLCYGTFTRAQNTMPPSDSKDSILLNNGRYIVAHIIDTTSFSVEIIKPNSRKKKSIGILKENIFSIKFGATGKESVFYVYDTVAGNDFTVEEARRFIAGEQDAQNGYGALGTSAGGFVIGVASGTVLSFFAVIPPFIYGGLMSYKHVKIRHKSVKNLENVKHDAYLYGYSLVARRKRTIRAFLWGGIGVVVGIAVHYTFFVSQN